MAETVPKKENQSVALVPESGNSTPVVDQPKVEIVEVDVPKQPAENVSAKSPDLVSQAAAPPEQEPPPPVKVSAGEKETLETKTEESTKEVSDTVPSIPQNAPLKIEENDEDEEEPAIEKRGKKIFVVGIGVTLVVVLLTGIIAFYLTSQLKQEPEVLVSEKVVTTPAPEPTSVPFNRQDWTFEVLNGSGIVGSAKVASDKLQSLGYTVIKTGNADKNNYSKSQILVSKDFQSKSALLLEDLKGTFDLATSSAELTESTASARLIIGKD